MEAKLVSRALPMLQAGNRVRLNSSSEAKQASQCPQHSGPTVRCMHEVGITLRAAETCALHLTMVKGTTPPSLLRQRGDRPAHPLKRYKGVLQRWDCPAGIPAPLPDRGQGRNQLSLRGIYPLSIVAAKILTRR